MIPQIELFVNQKIISIAIIYYVAYEYFYSDIEGRGCAVLVPIISVYGKDILKDVSGTSSNGSAGEILTQVRIMYESNLIIY